jgi:hypothetical protein
MLCGHNICRDCCLKITKAQIERDGWIIVKCTDCNNTNEIDFNMLDANHHLLITFHQIKKQPKPIINGPIFICDKHEEQEIQRKCILDGEFCCIDCLDDHASHF